MRELATLPDQEFAELTAIYVARGLDETLAREVARQLTAKDALGAHARDELGIGEHTVARPIQAAVTSAATFATGATLPVLGVLLTPPYLVSGVVSSFSLLLLGGLGAVGARVGRAHVWRAAARVTFWGALAMGITAVVGRLFGVTA